MSESGGITFRAYFLNESQNEDVPVISNALLPWQFVQIEPEIEFAMQPSTYYTVALVDNNSVGGPSAPYLHWLIVNINNKSPGGNVILQYTGPNPPPDLARSSFTDRPQYHRYTLVVYQQPTRFIVKTIREYVKTKNVPTFPIGDFEKMSGLLPLDSVSFYVMPQSSAVSKMPQYRRTLARQPEAVSNKSTTRTSKVLTAGGAQIQESATEYGPKKAVPTEVGGIKYIRSGANISADDASTCRCVLHVAASQPDWCLNEKAWGQTRTISDEFKGQRRETCYNPYAVCVARRKRGYPGTCSENFDFEKIPDAELIAYARTRGNIAVPQPWSRNAQLKEIAKYVCVKDKQNPVCSNL